MLRYTLLWLLLLVIYLAGCGTEENVVTAIPSGQPGSGRMYAGRVKLDTYYQGEIEFTETGGRTLYQVKTDARGWAFFRGALPSDFRLTARRGSDVYVREIRGGWNRHATMYVNEATTLASVYMKAHPELTLEQAEARVHDFLRLPAGYELSWLNVVKAPGYSSAEFYRGVQAAGSLSAYLDLLVTEMDGRLVLRGLADIGLSLLGTAGSALFSNTVNDAAGSVVSKMGYNFTVSGALSNVESQLTGIQSELAGFQRSVANYTATQAVTTALANIAGNVTVLNTTTSSIASNVTSYLATHGGQGQPAYNAPSGDNLNITNVASQLEQLKIEEQANSIVDALLGINQSSLYSLFAAEQMTQIDQVPSGFNNYPWRMNTLTDQQSTLQAQQIDSLCQAANLICEYANLQLPWAGPALTAARQVATLQAQVQQANQFIPDDMASDELILDMENSDINGCMMWSNTFYASMNYNDALAAAAEISFGPLGEFTLAAPAEMDALVQNRVIRATASPTLTPGQWNDSGSSNWIDAFQTAGFNTTNYGQYSDPGNPSRSNDEGSWVHLESGSSNNLYFWNNTGDNPSQTEGGSDSTSDNLNPWLAVRYYPGDAELNGQASYFVGCQLKSALTVGTSTSTAQGVQMTAVAGLTAGSDSAIEQPVTDRVVWTSSNPDAASVSNLLPLVPSPGASPIILFPPGPIGLVTWHPPVNGSPLPSVTITASLFGVSAANAATTINATGSRTITPPPGLAPVLKQVQFLPVNLSFDLLSNNNVTQSLYLTSYYQDGQIIDVSTDANTTWSVFDANGQPLNPATQGGFGQVSTLGKNALTLTSNITTPTVTVNASYQGPYGSGNCTGQFALQIRLTPSPSPTPPPPPSVTLVSPPSGPPGTAVTIIGKNFVQGATTATFNGAPVPVTFFSTSELQVVAPPGTGTATVVITTPGGSATTAFVYN